MDTHFPMNFLCLFIWRYSMWKAVLDIVQLYKWFTPQSSITHHVSKPFLSKSIRDNDCKGGITVCVTVYCSYPLANLPWALEILSDLWFRDCSLSAYMSRRRSLAVVSEFYL